MSNRRRCWLPCNMQHLLLVSCCWCGLQGWAYDGRWAADTHHGVGAFVLLPGTAAAAAAAGTNAKTAHALARALVSSVAAADFSMFAGDNAGDGESEAQWRNGVCSTSAAAGAAAAGVTDGGAFDGGSDGGEVYVGGWASGLRHGFGVLIDIAAGTTFEVKLPPGASICALSRAQASNTAVSELEAHGCSCVVCDSC